MTEFTCARCGCRVLLVLTEAPPTEFGWRGNRLCLECDDGNPAEHGRDTAIFQELQPIRAAFRKWFTANRADFLNDEMYKATRIEALLDEISDELNTPL